MSDDQELPGTALRRAVLIGAGMAGIGAVLASCSSDASTKHSANATTVRHNAPPTTSEGGGTAESGPGTATGAPGTGAAGSASAGKELASAGDIPVGGGKVFGDQKVVVTQPVAGEFRAFSSVCPHGGCMVSTVIDGVIKCPCHGSLFSANDGSVKAGPALRPLPAKVVTLRSGDIYLQPD